jgi:hypothetical protein
VGDDRYADAGGQQRTRQDIQASRSIRDSGMAAPRGMESVEEAESYRHNPSRVEVTEVLFFQKIPDNPETFEIVDGQQRLAAIFEFFDNDLELAAASAKRFGGKTYRDLPDTYADLIDDYKIEFDVIEDADEADVKELFQRLQEGLPTASSEKLNSIHSNLRNFVMRLTKHSFFDKVAASDKRYGHFDIMSKVTAIEIDGIDVGLRYDDLRAVFESQATFSAQSNVAKRLKQTLDFADAGFKCGARCCETGR